LENVFELAGKKYGLTPSLPYKIKMVRHAFIIHVCNNTASETGNKVGRKNKL